MGCLIEAIILTLLSVIGILIKGTLQLSLIAAIKMVVWILLSLTGLLIEAATVALISKKDY